MKTKKIKIGIMGCANIAKRSVIPAIKELSQDFELIAVASRTASKANDFAETFECEPVIGYDSLLNKADISAVYIPLPTGLHKEWIIKALKAGKHIYSEKSIAFNFLDAKEMVDLAKSKNLVLMEGYMFVFHTQHTIIKQLIENGEIGAIRTFRSSFGFPPLDKDNFRYKNDLGGGVVFDAAGYPLRASHLMLDSDLRVSSSSLNYSSAQDIAIYGNAFLKNELGLSAHISFGFDNYYQCNYEIWGSHGKLTANKAFTPKPDENPDILIENDVGKRIISAPADNHFKNAFVEFAELIKRNKDKDETFSSILTQSKSLDEIIRQAH